MTTNSKNLWILTEERPKKGVLQMIFSYFAKDHECGFFGQDLKILPILDDKKCFSFTYEVIGFNSSIVNHIYIKTISGVSSFTDFLIYYQNDIPRVSDTPLYAIEETKTDDKESRNTGVYQRCSKFVYIKNFYPKTKMVMLYALKVGQKEKPTNTYIFGTRLLLTLGVDIIGKELDSNIFKPFANINEVIRFKNNMPRPKSSTNIPILLRKTCNAIYISGRLYKNNSLTHDPNIGAISIISAVIRKLGWQKDIIVTEHGLSQNHVGKRNKFVQIANLLDISLSRLTIPKIPLPTEYWHYDITGEKLGTIFIHTVVENFTEGYSIFDNHAGCEKSYFMTSKQEYIPLQKYSDREAYKAGDKTKIVSIPDLVLLDISENEIITIEGKKYCNKQDGIDELNGYDSFDKLYLNVHYPHFKIVRTVVLYGSNNEKICEIEVGFLLNEKGKLILGVKAPKIFTRAITNLLDYWK